MNPPQPSSPASPAPSWFSGILPRGRSDKSAALNMAGNPCSGDPAIPIRGKNQFRGILFKYGPKPAQVAFRTGEYKQQVIFIGGLTDGFVATEYLEPLAIALDKEGWSLVQMLLSSSYIGYGTSSLQQVGLSLLDVRAMVVHGVVEFDVVPPLSFPSKLHFYQPSWKDAAELDQLVSYLINKEGSEGVVLLGQSTGCQDIVYYMHTNAACSRAVRGAILQAPVSNREYRATLPETARLIDLATTMRSEGRGSELMPREADPSAPITADRYYSLCAYMGDDDMFSSDLSDDQLRTRLGHMSNTPCQVIFSMADEYVPEYVDKKALIERLCIALGGAEKVEIEHGNHALSNRLSEAVHAIVDFIKQEGPKGWDDPWH